MNFATLTDHRVKMKENEKRDKYLDLTRELKKIWNMEVNGDTNCSLDTNLSAQRLEKKKDWRNWKSEQESRPQHY